jgi:polyisoprenoid-binding protein YceI
MKAMNAIARPALLFAMAAAAVYGQSRAIDTSKSVMTVRVYKAGVFSAFGHDHEIGAPIAAGKVDVAAHKVELRVEAGSLRVKDAKVSEKDRAEIEKTMLGPEVLDADRHSAISFQSTAVSPAGSGGWNVRGNLTLHGETRPVTVEVREKENHYVGNALLNQTEFGIKPVKVAGGTVKVKDQIRIEFDIQLAATENTRTSANF